MASASVSKEPLSNKMISGKTKKASLKGKFWKSTLFNEIYLDQDIYRNSPEKWDIDGEPEFEA